MKRANQTEAQWRQLQAEAALAQQAFDASHARLQQSLKATEAGLKPVSSLAKALKLHVTAAACLLAMGRTLVTFRKRQAAKAKPGAPKPAAHRGRTSHADAYLLQG
jgi:hypothetical protein